MSYQYEVAKKTNSIVLGLWSKGGAQKALVLLAVPAFFFLLGMSIMGQILATEMVLNAEIKDGKFTYDKMSEKRAAWMHAGIWCAWALFIIYFLWRTYIRRVMEDYLGN